MAETTIIGIGNTLMGDDGVGVVVARALASGELPPDVTVVQRANAEMGLMRYFTGSEQIIVIDAIDTGTEPGAIFRFDPDVTGVTALRSNNIHGMGVGFLLTNARLQGARPSVVVYGIQVGDIRPRPDSLSAEVERASGAVVTMIRQELESRAREAPGPCEAPVASTTPNSRAV